MDRPSSLLCVRSNAAHEIAGWYVHILIGDKIETELSTVPNPAVDL